LIDLSKAFDCIDNEVLIAKLHANALLEMPFKLFIAICQKVNKEFKLLVGLAYGKKFCKGVPHGSVRGPLLFSVFELFNLMNKSKLRRLCENLRMFLL